MAAAEVARFDVPAHGTKCSSRSNKSMLQLPFVRQFESVRLANVVVNALTSLLLTCSRHRNQVVDQLLRCDLQHASWRRASARIKVSVHQLMPLKKSVIVVAVEAGAERFRRIEVVGC